MSSIGNSDVHYIKNFYQDEIRDGFLVTAYRKKVFETYLKIWKEFDRICSKYNLKYWAAYGTLLGIEHYSGFIPWDDDMDFYMFRPDYNTLTEVIYDNLNPDFNVYIDIPTFLKIGYNNSTILCVDKKDNKSYSGLILDITPLDILPDGKDETKTYVNRLCEYMNIYWSNIEKDKYQTKFENILTDEEIDKCFKLKEDNKLDKYIKDYAFSIFDKSDCVGELKEYYLNQEITPDLKLDYNNTLLLDFETIKLPCPIGYRKINHNKYGDFKRAPRHNHSSLGYLCSVDIPYKEFEKSIDLELYKRK